MHVDSFGTFTVITGEDCLQRSPLQLTEFPGYLSSIVVHPDRLLALVESRYCLVRIAGPPGTKVLLTLHDFASGTSIRDKCVIYAEVSDSKAGTNQVICAGQTGRHDVITSHGNELTVKIAAATKENDRQRFLLKYESTYLGLFQ